MADQDRTPGNPLGDQLIQRAKRFSFFQLVRLLERCSRGSARVGYEGPASAEAVRFRPDTSLSFPASDISALELVPVPGTEKERHRITTTFLGLYGASSPLPSFYSEEVLWADEEQSRIRDFLDIFHHRFLSLFYRCWSKYRYAIQFEYGEADPLTPGLFSLIGIDSRMSHWEAGLPEPLRLLHFAGLINQQPHSAAALESIVGEYFDRLPVEIEQCTGRWVRIPEKQKTSLGKNNCRLSLDCSPGSRVFSRMGSFRVWIGPVTFAMYLDFLPVRENYRTLCSLIEFFTTDRLEFDIAFRVMQTPRTQLSSKGQDDSRARLGWTTWLQSAPSGENREETVIFRRASFEEAAAHTRRPA